MREVTLMLERVEQGDPQAAHELLPLIYGELRRLAAAKMSRESTGQTLQATALVHEAWLRLGADEQPAWRNRAHFFAAAAEAMRRILIERARRRRSLRHGGGWQRVDVDDPGIAIPAPARDEDEMLDVHEALDALAVHDARKAELVKLAYFAGFTIAEAAGILDISEPTAWRDWAYARAWLFHEIKRMRAAPAPAGTG